MVYLRNTDSILDIDVRGQDVIFNNYYDSINNVIAALKGPVAKTQVPRDASMISLIENYELDVLIVAFETLNDVDLDDRLWELTHEADNRYSRYADKHTFSNYYKNHPGIEHKAGVPKGGTLVLVYKNYIPNFNAIGLKSSNTPTFKASNAASQVVGMAATPVGGQKAAVSSELDVNTLNMVKKMVADSKGVSDTEKMRLIDILAGRDNPVPEPSYDINNKIIIADFYVPYIGSPTEYSSAEMTPPPPPAPVITMGNTFCDNDTNAAPITVSIPGGTFNAIPGLDPIKQTFIPAIAKAGTYRIIYTVNNVSSDPFVVNVLPVPDSRFTFINDWSGSRVKDAEVVMKAAVGKGIVSATFTPNVRDSRFTYDWKVSGNATKGAVAADGVIKISSDTSVVNVRASTVEVSLTISNGNCHSSTSSMELDVSSIGFSPVPSDGPPVSVKKPGAIEKLFTRKKKS